MKKYKNLLISTSILSVILLAACNDNDIKTENKNNNIVMNEEITEKNDVIESNVSKEDDSKEMLDVIIQSDLLDMNEFVFSEEYKVSKDVEEKIKAIKTKEELSDYLKENKENLNNLLKEQRVVSEKFVEIIVNNDIDKMTNKELKDLEEENLEIYYMARNLYYENTKIYYNFYNNLFFEEISESEELEEFEYLVEEYLEDLEIDENQKLLLQQSTIIYNTSLVTEEIISILESTYSYKNGESYYHETGEDLKKVFPSRLEGIKENLDKNDNSFKKINE